MVEYNVVAVIFSMACLANVISASHHSPYTFTDALLRQVVEKMSGNDRLDSFLNYPTERRVQKQMDDENDGLQSSDYTDLLDPQEAMIRDQEFLQHSSLWGHQYVQGGAGEGKQHLKPDGSMKNIHEIKTDGVLPAYCDPPNPCPNGATSIDGCLENFVNTAAFSREYQAAQDCMCDTEHMFDCPSSSQHDEIDALAQSIQSQGINEKALDRILEGLQIEDAHKSLVAKKHFDGSVKEAYLRDLRSKTSQMASSSTKQEVI
ncbi:hypothetical protein CHUAL_001976 [Chamberlinius hualienensis]